MSDFSDSTFSANDGFVLVSFLTSGGPGAGNTDAASTFGAGAVGGIIFDEIGVASGGPPSFGNVTDLDLNLFDAGNSAALPFSTAFPAFVGSATFDLSALALLLPAAGALGDIQPGDFNTGSTGLGPVIGQWKVIDSSAVPIPGSIAFIMSGLSVGLFVARRRKMR